MGIIIALDFGEKRTGIAVTDPMQIIASGLTTLATPEVISFLKNYCTENKVDECVIGLPKQMDNSPSQVEPEIHRFIQKLSQAIPSISIERYDERFTSKMAFQSMLDGGLKKEKRKNKGLVDKISATLLLQSYLDASLHSKNKK
ncbi:Holliday junction resolvase RuvX [Flavobacteriaceae bacterium]|nr:Holliday junction resolvase RuvX [Flavobacteriaceae bacterium]